jgi:hypothetical protein
LTEIGDSAKLAGCDLHGRPASWEVKGDQVLEVPGSALITQRVRTADDRVMVCRSLSATSDDRSFTLLDNEIRALARLTIAFGGDPSAPYPELIGYDMDSSEPWALVGDHRGRPARDAVTGLLKDGLHELTIRVLDLLVRMAVVEVCHGKLSLSQFLLDGTELQLTGFEHAALYGEPRVGFAGVAGPREDLVDAGRLLYEAYSGVPAHQGLMDRDEVPELYSLLPELFQERSEPEPRAVDMLRRLVTPDRLPVAVTPDALRAGREAFDIARRRKLGATQPQEPEASTAAPRRRSRWSRGQEGKR